jgi:hypothetical protein
LLGKLGTLVLGMLGTLMSGIFKPKLLLDILGATGSGILGT